mgnify:CR=1 FL=1
MASPHQWPSIAPDLSWLQTIIWLLSLGILPTRIKTKPNHRNDAGTVPFEARGLHNLKKQAGITP